MADHNSDELNLLVGPNDSNVVVDSVNSDLSSYTHIIRDNNSRLEELAVRITEHQNRLLEIERELQNREGGYGVRLESGVETGRRRKRDSSCLVDVGTALDLEVKKDGEGGYGSFFDCSICLEMAREPIVTCCGHLFCWECFYQVEYVDPCAKECPVCKGQVKDDSVTPIYGNGYNEHVGSELESGLRVPPRPVAHRVESVRQQRVGQSISQIQVVDVLRRFRNGLDSVAVDSPRQTNLDGVTAGSDTALQMLPDTEAVNTTGLGSHQVSIALPESVGQQRVGRNISLISVVDVLRRLRNGLDSVTVDPPRQNNLEGVNAGSNTDLQVLPDTATVDTRGFGSHQVSTGLPESDTTVSSRSSAFNNEGRSNEESEATLPASGVCDPF